MFRFVLVSFGAHAAIVAGAVLLGALASSAQDPVFDPEGALLGETMAVDLESGELAQAGLEGTPGDPGEAHAPAPEAAPATPAKPAEKAEGAGHTAPPPPPPASRPAGGGGGELGGGQSQNAGLFGAVGDRAAADLATAFVRGFPQVASVDAAWAHVPFGPLASAVIELQLTEEGKIESYRVLSAPAPLDRALERTVGLLKGRKFTSRGAKTKLVLKCVVSSDTVHDGLHGEVFAVGASFVGKSGNAFFALASGRRVDVDVSLGR